VTTYCKTVAIFTAKSQFQTVDDYYKLVPFETASDMFTLSVQKIVRVPDLTFDDLLTTMTNESANFDMFLIVDHGLQKSLKDKTVTQLSMPLVAKRTTKTRQDICEKLLEFMNGSTTAEDNMTKFDKQQGLPVGTCGGLVDKMKTLRKKKVRWVNIRACAMGNNPAFMDAFGQCLSALFISAPDVHMFYSKPLQPNHKYTEASLKAFGKFPGARTFDDGAGNQLALRVTGTGPDRHVTGQVTADEIHWFFDQYFDKGHRYPPGNRYFKFQIEGMDLTGAPYFALPREPEYAQHIVWRGPLPNNMIGSKP
jgi:hypothetical protein